MIGFSFADNLKLKTTTIAKIKEEILAPVICRV